MRCPGWGSTPHPPTGLGTWGENFLPSLSTSRHLSLLQMSGQRERREQSWRKTSGGAAEKGARLHKRCLVPPARRSGQRVPSLALDGKPSSKHSFITHLPPAAFCLPLGHEMFSGGRNLKFYTSPPGSARLGSGSPWARSGRRPQVPPHLTGMQALRRGHRLLVIQ